MSDQEYSATDIAKFVVRQQNNNTATLALVGGITLQSGEPFIKGTCVRMNVNGKIYKSANDAPTEALCIGVSNEECSSANQSVLIAVMQGSVLDFKFSTPPNDNSCGKKVYLDTNTNDGLCTMVAPTLAGTEVVQVGILIEDGDGSNTLRKCLLQIQHISTNR
tara:strand:+ start:36344 stop:36832 length:489 start_codon:yes stop_codon:yes gene_type:complete